MKCPDCSNELPDSATFCDECGARLDRRKFGRFRITKEVGRGAMGVVFLARDDKIGRNVAIKALELDRHLPEEDQQEIKDRFEREARAAGMLSHPNIVTIFDVGEEGGTPYIAMEFLEGAPLSEVILAGHISVAQAVMIIEQVLSALDYAHAHEIVHRDIKPDNVFLLPDGRVKVADFGIARLGSMSRMTQHGQVLGTPGYMSPEQVKGESLGPASDIFSTGIVLYELLTGAPAFSSSSNTSVMYKIVHEDPELPHLLNPDVPPYLEAVILRATAKNPRDRYASAAAMRNDVSSGQATMPAKDRIKPNETVLRSGPVEHIASLATPVAPAPRKRRTGLLIGGIAAAVLVLAGMAVLLVVLLIGSTQVVVPSLIGKTMSEAREIAAEHDLKIGTNATAESDRPAGEIVRQDPESGEKVDREISISVKTSGGPAQATQAAPPQPATTGEPPSATYLEDQATEADQNAPFYTVVIASLDQRTGHTQGEAERMAQGVRSKGLPAGVLDSNRFKSLRRPYWVVYSGIYQSQTTAEVNLPDVQAAGYPEAYVRYVSYEGPGETGPIVP